MKKEGIFVIVFVIGFSLLLFNYEPSYNSKDGTTGLAMFAACTSDDDCDTGYICEDNSCTLGCLEDADCAAGKGTCDLETGRCVAKGECTGDGDCSGETPRCDLSSQTCVECLYQRDCAGDLVCNLDTNKCEEAAEPEPEPAKNECVDSDGGEEIHVYGTLSGTDIHGNVIDQTDQCSGNKLFEKICTEESYTYVEHTCEHGCEDGVCLEEIEEGCEDSDGGKEYYSKGTTTKGSSSTGDICNSADGVIPLNGVYPTTAVREGFCEDNTVQTEYYDCPHGCEMGACLEEPEIEEEYIDSLNPDQIHKGSTLGNKYVAIKYEPTIDYELDKIGFYTGLRGMYNSPSQLLVQIREDDNANPDFPKAEVLGETKITLEETLSWQGTKFPVSVRIHSGRVYWIIIKVEGNSPDVYTPMSKDGIKSAYRGSHSGTGGWDGPYSNSWMMKFYGEEAEPEVIVQVACTDSDDQNKKFPSSEFSDSYGLNYDVKGTTSGIDEITKEHTTSEDVCSQADPYKLFEYYCKDGTTLTLVEYMCRGGCEEGACKEEAKANLCVDSDGGEEIHVYGTLNGTDIHGNVIDQTDQCSGNKLFEKICTEESYTYVEHTCEHGCEEGACLEEAKAMCTDPDGDDISQATTTTYTDENGNQQTMADRCIGLIGVFEGLCTEEGTFGCADQADCRRRCPQGQVCSNGACQATTVQCTDSDGENKNRAGTVTYTLVTNNAEVTIKDRCASQRFVKEGVCNVINQGRIKILKCKKDELCRQGACIPSPEQCTDSDGKDRTKKGTVEHVNVAGRTGQFTDTCVNKNQVYEGVCKLNTFIFRGVPCPPGTTCDNGACREGVPGAKLSCKDTDGGDRNTKGVVTYTDEEGKEHSKTDSCKDQHYVIENYCYANTPREVTRLCSSGCSAGKCKERKRWGGRSPFGGRSWR